MSNPLSPDLLLIQHHRFFNLILEKLYEYIDGAMHHCIAFVDYQSYSILLEKKDNLK